jgi:quinolinate synthase
MSQTIYTKSELDASTGEVITKEWLTKKVSNSEQFIRTYIDDICTLAKCRGSEQSFILCSLKYLDYNTNELVLNPARRTEIAQCANMKMNTLNMAVSSLYKKNMLIKVDQKTYLNPKLFFYGTDIARNTVFKLVINYQIV